MLKKQKEKRKLSLIERIKLKIANTALRIADSLLAKEKERVVEVMMEVEKARTPDRHQQLNRRKVDFMDDDQFDKKGEQDMKEFYGDLVDMVSYHIRDKSALTIAGPLMAHAMKIYKSVLPPEDYDNIIFHIYEGRHNIEPIDLPQEGDKKNNTVH
jgi:hypothetical protein